MSLRPATLLGTDAAPPQHVEVYSTPGAHRAPRGVLPTSPRGVRGPEAGEQQNQRAPKWRSPQKFAVRMPSHGPPRQLRQANSLYPHENQWTEQIALNYVK